MKILIAGIDGYIGWALAQHLAANGHKVGGVDAFYRRAQVVENGSHSAIPICSIKKRLAAFKDHFGYAPYFISGDLTEWNVVRNAITEFKPDSIVHLGENPSAPYSMMDRDKAVWVQMNNVVSTFNILFAMREFAPQAHLVKLGTMGEYGTPNIDIAEGFLEIEHRGRKDYLPFPKQGGSWYHLSKVHSSNNIMLACKLWKLTCTDVMQGVVFGTRTDTMIDDVRMATRFDFDSLFGTAINRFCCQAVIGSPITPYGKGGQRRGFIPLRDSVTCLTLALNKPPKAGEYRVLNQFEAVYGINELADKVKEAACALGLNATIAHVENPRHEMEQHYFNPDNKRLLDLGYLPSNNIERELELMLSDLIKHKARILSKQHLLIPSVRWDGNHRISEYIAK